MALVWGPGLALEMGGCSVSEKARARAAARVPGLGVKSEALRGTVKVKATDLRSDEASAMKLAPLSV